MAKTLWYVLEECDFIRLQNQYHEHKSKRKVLEECDFIRLQNLKVLCL